MIEIIEGHSYLVHKHLRQTESVEEVKILLCSEKAYKLKFLGHNTEWKSKSVFEKDYDVVEDITELINLHVVSPINYVPQTHTTICPHCNGSGRLSLTVLSFCPHCNGLGFITRNV